MHRGEDRKTLSKGIKELEAEAVAYVVSTAAGLSGSLEHSADYIQCHKGDSEQLANSLGRIQKTADSLLERLQVVGAEPLVAVA